MSLLIQWLEGMHIDVEVSGKCLRKSNLHSTCSFCENACTIGALSITRQTIEINQQQCNSCGDCVIACPLAAIVGNTLSRKFHEGSLIYSENFTPTVKELLIYKKRGIQSIQIERHPLNPNWENVVTETNGLLKFLGEPPIEIVQKGKREEMFSRRSLFSILQNEGKQLIKGFAPDAWKLEENIWNLANYYPEYQFYLIEMNRKECTLCQACFSFCSQKVFQLEDHTLQVNHEKCVGCMACIDICSEKAISIKTGVAKKSIAREPLQVKKCIDCGQTYHTFQANVLKCHVCKDRNSDWLSPYQ